MRVLRMSCSRKGQRRIAPWQQPVRTRFVNVALLALAFGGVAASSAASATAADGWGFEQVTPVSKGSGAVSSDDTFRASEDGNSFLYTSVGSLDGAPSESVPMYTRYAAHRGDDGWVNRALDPLATFPAPWQYIMGVVGSSANLQYTAVTSTRALTPGAIEGGGNLYLRNTRTGAFTLVAASAVTDPDLNLTAQLTRNSGALAIRHVANDGRSMVFRLSDQATLPEPLTPDADGVTAVLYSWTADDGLRVLSEMPDGTVVPANTFPGDSEVGPRESLPASDDLEHVYFGTSAGGYAGAYVRTGGVTKAVSYSRIPGASTAPTPAKVLTVSRDGRYMLFQTDTTRNRPPLTEDTPVAGTPANAQFLYRYDQVNDSLTYIGMMGSRIDPGGIVLQMSQDGGTIAFQTTRDLDGNGASGMMNMYVWRNGTLRFVATSDPGSSATNPGAFQRRLSPDGRYLAFTDNTVSLAERVDYDNVSSGCPDEMGDPGPCDVVYVYDADDDKLECASCRPDGGRPFGDAGDPSSGNSGRARMDQYTARTVVNDGSVFFTTSDALLPELDSNGTEDVYAYRRGELRLISRARQNTSSRFLDASPDGSTVFIATNDPIVGTDTDRERDVYMTRAGAGFPFDAPPTLVPCSGIECREPGQLPTPPVLPGTDRPSTGGNQSPAATPVRVSVTRSTLRRSTLRLKVRTNTRGRIRVSGSQLRTVTRTVSRDGTFTISVPLTKKSAQRLRSRGRLAVKTRVSVTPPFGRSAVAQYRRTLRN